MRAVQRINLIDKIGRDLQSRYTYSDIDSFLRAFRIEPPQNVAVNSKYVYAKAALANVDDAMLVSIASELGDDNTSISIPEVAPPVNWQGASMFRLFISHISAHKDKATRLKDCLHPYGISGFVAHEDILPTLEWQVEIERALRSMDAFIAIHTDGFSKSVWTQQEIGFAVGRGIRIISLKMGEDPTGFISKQQALSRQKRTAEEIALEVDNILSKDPKTSERLSKAKAASKTFDLDNDIPF